MSGIELKDPVLVSTDKPKLQIDMIYDFLRKSYWALGVTLEDVRKRIENSICFGLYKGEVQVGFARVITDQISFAYIADLFIVESERGKGYSKLLMNSVCFHESLLEVKNWYLITMDAQMLYEKLGFCRFKEVNREVMHCSRDELKLIND